MDDILEFPSADTSLTQYLYWATESGGKFHTQLIEHLARYPVSIREFIEGDSYLGLKSVYPTVIESLEQVYNGNDIHLGCPTRRSYYPEG